MKKLSKLLLIIVLLSPIFSFAQTVTLPPRIPLQTGTMLPSTQPGVAPPIGLNSSNCSNKNIQGLLVCVSNLLQMTIPYTASLALVYFLWGVSKILRGQGDMKAIEEGRRTAFRGVIALFIIASIGGIILFLQHDLIGGSANTIFR